MRAAPAVDYPVSQDGGWRCVSAALGGLVAAVPAAWVVSHVMLAAAPVSALHPSVWMALAASAAAVIGARVGWRRSRVTVSGLVWDGGAWFRRTAPGVEPEAGVPELALDWGDWLLLRWHGTSSAAGALAGRVTWLPLARRDLPSHWHLLRVALRQSARGSREPQPAGADAGRGDTP